jgi:hypothetical protein
MVCVDAKMCAASHLEAQTEELLEILPAALWPLAFLKYEAKFTKGKVSQNSRLKSLGKKNA